MYPGPNIVKDGLVLALDAASPRSYPGSGTIWYDLVNTNNGTLTNGPTFDSGVGGSIVFDGTNDYVSIPDPSNTWQWDVSFAIEMWVNPDDVSNRREFIGQYEDSDNWWRWGNDDLDQWEVDIQEGGTRTLQANPSWDVVNGSWQQICLSRGYNATSAAYEWNFYLNGTLDGSDTNSVKMPNLSTALYIGNSTGENFDGKISNVHIYNRYLEAREVLQNYNALKHRFI